MLQDAHAHAQESADQQMAKDDFFPDALDRIILSGGISVSVMLFSANQIRKAVPDALEAQWFDDGGGSAAASDGLHCGWYYRLRPGWTWRSVGEAYSEYIRNSR